MGTLANAMRGLIISAVIVSQAHAYSPEWLDAICIVQAGSARGTGVVVSCTQGKAVLLTNHHVVGRARTITATWENGYPARGSVVWRDRNADQAIVQIQLPEDSACLPVSTKGERPHAGDAVQIAAFGGGKGELTVWNSKVNGYRESSSGRHEIEVYGNVISGDSGGAIIHNDKIVAVLWGGPVKNTPSGPRIYATRGTIAEFAIFHCPRGT